MDDAELVAIVAEEVAKVVATGASGGRAMGESVKAVRARVGSGADGARVAAAVNTSVVFMLDLAFLSSQQADVAATVELGRLQRRVYLNL